MFFSFRLNFSCKHAIIMVQYSANEGEYMNNIFNNEFTLLSEEQEFGSQKIDIIRQIGGKCAISDFAILLGAYVCYYDHVDDDSSLRGRTCLWYLSSSDGAGDVRSVDKDGDRRWTSAGKRCSGVRPVLPYSNISDISQNGVRGRSGILEVEYGEYPQYAPDLDMQRTLESELSAGKLKKTGKAYTTDSRRWDANYESFKAREHQEYEYNGKKYVKVNYIDKDSCILSNGETYNNGDEVWVEVAPIASYHLEGRELDVVTDTIFNLVTAGIVEIV